MQCPYCGREVKEGEVFCECGRPVNVGGAGASGAAGSNPYLPEGVTLESLHKPPKQTNMITFIFVIGAICIGIILFFVFKNKGGSDVNLDDQSKWQRIDRPNYSMRIPSALKDEKDRMLTIGDSAVEMLDFFSGEDGAVLINREAWDDTAKQIIKDNGLDTVKQIIAADFSRRTKAEGTVVNRLNYIYLEFETTKKNYIGKTDNVYEVYAGFVTDQAFYTVQVFCAQEDKDKYAGTLIKWLDTFEPK